MSSRVLRKLQGEKDLVEEPNSDPDTDLPISGGGGGGARRKQLNINRFDLLNQQSHSESEVKEDDNETEANNAPDHNDGHEATKRKKKKRKKKSGKSISARRSSEDNADVDEIERTIREVNKLLGESQSSTGPLILTEKYSSNVRKSVLSIQHRNLNPNNELKRIFGSKIIQNEHKRKNRGRGHLKSTWLVTGKENWPQVGKNGLSMSLVENKDGTCIFTYEHSQSYQQIQKKFLEAVESLNPDNIVAIINNHPYHVDALIQLSDLCRLSEDLAMAAELIERALYCLEYSFHPLFNLAQGNCRLDYRRQENRAFFITLFKHLIFVGGRACYRTALEFCKVLLSLSPEEDPLAVILAIDFYALRSREYQWLVQFCEEWESRRNLSQLPNFAFSLAIAHFHLATAAATAAAAEGDLTLPDKLLQDALIMFPGLLVPLLEKCSIQVDARVQGHAFFGAKAQTKQAPALATLIKLYICRTYHVYKEADILPWLEKNVHTVLDRVDANADAADAEFIKDCEAKRSIRYQGTPRNILRHIILSDIKEVTPPFTEETQGPVLGFDPVPPPDSINLYSKPKGPTRIPSNTSTVGIFFQSLLPNFNNLTAQVDQLNDARLGDGARGGPAPLAEDETNRGDLQRSVASLVDAMRDLLSNIRLPDLPNDADVDDSGDSEDDEDHNNYLT